MPWNFATSDGGAKSTVVGSPNYACRAYRNTAQSIATGTQTLVLLDLESFDYGGMHDVATNNTRLTAPVSGVYDINGTVAFDLNSTGDRAAQILLNGTTTIAYNQVDAAASIRTIVTVSIKQYLNAGEYIELNAFQNSGSALDISATDLESSLEMTLHSVTVVGSANISLPRFKRTSNADGSLPNATTQKIQSFANTDVYGSADFWDSTNHRLVVPDTGDYVVAMAAQFEPNATGDRVLFMTLNTAGSFVDANLIAWHASPSSSTSFTACRQIFWEGPLTTSDHIEFWVRQQSGGSLNLLGAQGENDFWITARRVL